MKLEHQKYIVNLNNKLKFYELGIMALDSEEKEGWLSVYLYLKASPQNIITKQYEFEDNDALEDNIINQFNLDFAYSEIKKDIVLKAYGTRYSKIMEVVKFLKEGCNVEDPISFKYNFPDGTVLINYGGISKFISLHEFDESLDQVCMRVLDLTD